MIVYHGSNHVFKTLRIVKSNERASTSENEGSGIYFSRDVEVARSYGKWLYTLKINNTALKDWRIKYNVSNYISILNKGVYNKFGIYLPGYFDMKQLILCTYTGGRKICELYKEIALLLDSCENWHLCVSNKTKNDVIKEIKRWNDSFATVYFFPCNIKDCGVAKILSEDIISIVSRESSY